MPEPVHITVAQVRQRIFGLARGGGGAPSRLGPEAARIGRLFHETAAELVREDSPRHWRHALADGNLDDPGRLARHAYEASLGAALQRNRQSLSQASEDVLLLWQAVQEFCRWLCELLRAAHGRGLITYDRLAGSWNNAGAFLRSEQDLQARFHDPAWRRPVVLTGRADLVIRIPGERRWCVIELKARDLSPEADTAQACLYYDLLAASQPGDAAGNALALLRFGPEIEEQLYSGPELTAARSALRRLIGEMAGVSGAVPAPPPPLPDAPESADWPRPPRDRDLALGKQIIAVLKEFGASASLSGEPAVGPAFVRFSIEPARRVKVSSILGQAMNLQVRLGLSREPMIRVARGKIAVDVQRQDREPVPFASVRHMLPGPDPLLGGSELLVGVDIEGQPEFADLAGSPPHLLVGGTPGSGKTEWLRGALASLLINNTPRTLRLVLIDPKRNAFSELKRSPYLLGENGLVCPPDDDVMAALDRLIEEMEERYRRLEQAGADDRNEFVRKTGATLPRIVCVCDEYADLVYGNRTARREIEEAVMRLGQKGRAAGVHLILATQRPSKTIVTGAIKASMPGRIALQVTDAVESRIVIECKGAENLLGRGDLLYGVGHPRRLQAPFLDAAERRAIFAPPRGLDPCRVVREE